MTLLWVSEFTHGFTLDTAKVGILSTLIIVLFTSNTWKVIFHLDAMAFLLYL